MSAAHNAIPIFALLFSQIPEVDGKLAIYGPLGIICMWLMWRDTKQREEYMRVHAEARVDNAKLREEISSVAHQMKGLNRNMLYMAATHGPSGVREVAARELERTNQS